MNIDLRMLETKVGELDGDIYLMTQTLKEHEATIKDLTAKYEYLLNKMKCIDCQNNTKE